MQRTVRVILKPSPEQAAILAETLRQFTSAFNHAVAIGWRDGVKNATKLHYITYREAKALHPFLVSDLIIQARVKAAEALTSAATLLRKGRVVSMPVSQACPPRLNKNTFKLDWAKQEVRMSTTGGRQSLAFDVPDYAKKYVGNPVDIADLIYRNGKWWLHVVVTAEAPKIEPSGEVVGVDLGLAIPAATSDNRFLGGTNWRGVEKRYFRLKRRLQKASTKSAKRHLRHMRGKQQRFRRDCDHVLSKRLVRSVQPGATIVLENLTNIRSRTKIKRKTETSRRIHGWSFAQLRGFIEYKAEERGCTVVAVDPRHTSQTCSACGHRARNNRRSRGLFQCRECGFTLNADLNAARNIRAKYLAGVANDGSGWLPVNQPIAGEIEFTHPSTRKPPALAGGC